MAKKPTPPPSGVPVEFDDGLTPRPAAAQKPTPPPAPPPKRED